MSHRVAGAPLDFAQLRAELEVPGDFASEALADAARAIERGLPEGEDATGIPFVTIDPPGSRDLDQALHIAEDGSGHVVHYAIADVASFVVPGGALDAETRRRGETIYFPDARVPLHPPALSEGAASLLPGQVRAAVLWRIHLDARGEATDVAVTRARVRSTAQLDYDTVQRQLDTGSLPAAVAALGIVGERRLARARDRHAIDLDLPEQLVSAAGSGWTIHYRAQRPVERYNAEISLLTGMCAASLMLEHGYGLLRTVPPAPPSAVASMRIVAQGLGVEWPEGAQPGDVLALLDRSRPQDVALIEHAVSLLRGSGYVVFDGASPEQPLHSGVAAPYTHVTAPLRRLVDRFTSEICLAHSAGAPVPDWVRAALPDLPAQMAVADQRAHQADRAVVDATEAWLLQDRVGERFDALVVDADARAGTVLLDDPAVRARCAGAALPIGERVRVRLVLADVATRTVRFARSDE